MATHCLTRIALYTEVDTQCDKLASVVGRASTVASTVNLVDRWRSPSLSHWTFAVVEPSTRCDARRALAKFSKCKLTYNTPCIMGYVERSFHATNQLDPFIRFGRTPTCDRQTDTDGHRATANAALHRISWVKLFTLRNLSIAEPFKTGSMPYPPPHLQWRHFSQTLGVGGGLTFHTQLLLRVRYCNAWQTIMQNIHIIGKNIANSYHRRNACWLH